LKIGIIGAGAMGGLFGAKLSLAGEEVWLYDHNTNKIFAIQEAGLTITDANETIETRPKASTDLAAIGVCDLVLIFVKARSTLAAAEAAKNLAGNRTAILTLQNGYGNAEQLTAILGSHRVLVGTTAQGSTFTAPGRVFHGGCGETVIGEFGGGISPRLKDIAAIFSRAGIITSTTDCIAPHIWAKLIINAGINALTAITRLPNGQLANYPETRELVELCVAEAVAVARTAKIALPFPDPLAKVWSVVAATSNNRSSMLQDIANCRPTEVDAINGAIVREGNKHGVATPVNRTITLLIKTLEKTAEEPTTPPTTR
jgi:2-dehydropantoate 2-reductase